MTGLEYFAFDTHLDTETGLLLSDYGADGMCILVLLLQSIYGDKGYFMKWEQRHQKYISKRLQISEERIQQIINYCTELEIFDKGMLENYGILTSSTIQTRYAEGCKRRKNVEFIAEYLLTDVSAEGTRKNISVKSINCIHDVTRCIHDVTTPAQSKVKESKVKKSKVKDNKENKESDEVVAVVDTPKGVYKEVYGTDEPAIESSLTKYLTKMDRELLIHVLTQAKADSKPWSWVTAVLDNHLKQGTRTLAEFKEKSKAHLGSSPPKNKFTDYTEQGNYDIEAMERRNLEKRMESLKKKAKPS